MAQPNDISLQIPEADQAEIKAAIQVLADKLLPHLTVTLSAEDRQELPKMGEKTVDFVQKSLEFCNHNKELVPPFLDVDEFEIDVKAVTLLRDFLFPLRELMVALEDTMMLSGSEAYQAALIFYATIKTAKKSKIQSAETIYKELSSRFPGSPGKTKT